MATKKDLVWQIAITTFFWAISLWMLFSTPYICTTETTLFGQYCYFDWITPSVALVWLIVAALSCGITCSTIMLALEVYNDKPKIQ